MQTKNSAFKNDHQSLGIFTQQPKYKLFADLSNRLNSFSKGFFGGPDTTEVAKAGFYHTGTDDIVQCFYCGLKLRNWTPSDNPWIEHARHGEHCPFVKNVKGRDFCQTVITKYDKDIEADSASSRCLYTDDLIFTTAAQALLNMKCYTREDITKAIKAYVARHGKVEFNAVDIAYIIHNEVLLKI